MGPERSGAQRSKIYFIFFLPLAKKEEGNPTHIAAHLQAPQLVPTIQEADAQNLFLR